jgi:hypothetical protein
MSYVRRSPGAGSYLYFLSLHYTRSSTTLMP